MPTIIVEDGSIVENANSYIDLQFLSDYSTDRNLTIPTDDTVKEQYILKGMDYLESLRDRFVGCKATELQSLQWPRKNVIIDGYEKDEDYIPLELQNALAELVIEQEKANPLFPEVNTDTKQGLIIQEKIGPLETRYSESSQKTASVNSPFLFPKVNAYLKSLVKSHIRAYRV